MNKLLLGALLCDVLFPILNWKAGLPDQLRWVSQAAVAIAMVIGCVRLLRQGSVPKAFALVPFFSVVGAAAAIMNGQSLMPTTWGWWLMFKWPLVGLYACLGAGWSDTFPRRFQSYYVILLAFELAVQALQFLGGQPPGDQLAGTLSWASAEQGQGAQQLALVSLLLMALAFGRWIVDGAPRQLLLLLALGLVSSLLSESKVFLPVVMVMGIIALGFRQIGRPLSGRTVLGMIALALSAFVFIRGFEGFVEPARRSTATIAWLSDPRNLSSYLTSVQSENGTYNIGRNYEIQVVWSQISASPGTLILGEGLGARGESKTLGTAGNALLSGNLGLFTGSSLAVILGELGVLGLIALTLFLVGVSHELYRAARRARDVHEATLLFGLLLYTIMWPVWLWYTAAWILPVSGLLYWTSLGYAFRRRRIPPVTQLQPAPLASPGTRGERHVGTW